MASRKGFQKYKAKPTEVDGIRFASKKEAGDYLTLKTLFQAGSITDLELQPQFKLIVNGVLICTYRADFQYRKPGEERLIVRDTKGFVTPEFKIKAKLFKALYPGFIFEVG